jgi:glucose-6-phosphate isomerase
MARIPMALIWSLENSWENSEKTLVVVPSKSGSTSEPRNAMVEVMDVYKKNGYSFFRHAVAITRPNSLLDNQARSENWMERFHMWDWVGGRTSLFSAI